MLRRLSELEVLNKALHFLSSKGRLVSGVIDQVSRAGHLGVIRLAFSTFPSLQSSSECNYLFPPMNILNCLC